MEQTKNRLINFRASRADWRLLAEIAEREGITKSGFLRGAIYDRATRLGLLVGDDQKQQEVTT